MMSTFAITSTARAAPVELTPATIAEFECVRPTLRALGFASAWGTMWNIM
jgi:hypothetical protein